MTMATTRERLHELLDDVPDARLDEIEDALLDAMAPYRPIEEAPEDDEPVTAEDLEAIRLGLEEHARGETIPHEEAMRRIGLR
jgi:predicted transcriptional regulator